MRGLTEDEIEEAYELNTGKVIVSGFEERGIDPVAVPGVLVRNHGPFTWGKDAAHAAYHAVVLEEVAKMARDTEILSAHCGPAPQYLLNKHYMRKHGRRWPPNPPRAAPPGPGRWGEGGPPGAAGAEGSRWSIL